MTDQIQRKMGNVNYEVGLLNGPVVHRHIDHVVKGESRQNEGARDVEGSVPLEEVAPELGMENDESTLDVQDSNDMKADGPIEGESVEESAVVDEVLQTERRSMRSRRKPAWVTDYVCDGRPIN